MMNQDIQKVRVLDNLINDDGAEVHKMVLGGSSINKQRFKASGLSTSQITFSVTPPSLNSFMSRNVKVAYDMVFKLNVSKASGATDVLFPNTSSNSHLIPNYLPFHQVLNNVNVEVNGVAVSTNTNQLLDVQQRLALTKHNKAHSLGKIQHSRYARFQDDLGQVNGVSEAYQSYLDTDTNATPVEWFYCDSNGNYTATPSGQNGLTSQDVFIRLRGEEYLMASPFQWNYDDSVGIFGINNMNISITLKSSALRAILYYADGSSLTGVNSATLHRFMVEPACVCEFATPNISQSLPQRNVVGFSSYEEFNSGSVQLAGTGTLDNPLSYPSQTVQTNNFILSGVPDYILMYARVRDTESDGNPEQYLPITRVQLQFDNVAGLLSNYEQRDLYELSRRNNMDIAYDEFKGYANGKNQVYSTAGGMLVLRPGVDFPIEQSLSQGVNGNFNVAANITLQNPYSSQRTADIRVVAVYRSYLMTEGNVSNIVKAPCTEQDVMNAPMAESMDGSPPLVGGSFLGNLWKGAKKVGKFLLKPEVRDVVKKGLKHFAGERGKKAADTLESVGYGMQTTTGGALVGGRKGRKYKSKKMSDLQALMV